jgi:hypothetical protein
MLVGKSRLWGVVVSDGVNSTLLEMWRSVGTLAAALGEVLQPESRPARRPASPRVATFKRRRAVRRAEEEGMSWAPRRFN